MVVGSNPTRPTIFSKPHLNFQITQTLIPISFSCIRPRFRLPFSPIAQTCEQMANDTVHSSHDLEIADAEAY